MRIASLGYASFALMVLGAFAPSALGASVAYVAPVNASNGSSSIQPGSASTTNLGYAFKTGSSGPFDIDWVRLELTSGASNASVSFKISIYSTNNEIPYSAVVGSTEHATDTVTITTPATANTPFELNLNASQIQNIAGYQLLPNTSYALFVNGSSGSIALRRTQGLANGTSNDNYTVSNGFTMLDTFRNNGPNYANIGGSYVTFAMSFGGTAAVPEPSALALFSVFVGGGLLRRRRTRR
jgi:hypothetical protein